MKRIALMLLLAMLPSVLWFSPASAQSLRPVAVLSLAQAERVAVDLKQGMSAEEVEKLLGKPQRTALKSNGGSPNTPSDLCGRPRYCPRQTNSLARPPAKQIAKGASQARPQDKART